MTCNGVCKRYKVKGQHPGAIKYKNGQKRCQTCELFIKWEGLWCPCCGYRLRTKPRFLNPQKKEKYRGKRIE